MSLITLKNDEQLKELPYSWRNYFRDPMIIKKNSSVSLVSATVNKTINIQFLDGNTFYYRVGVPGLNPVVSFSLGDISKFWKLEPYGELQNYISDLMDETSTSINYSIQWSTTLGTLSKKYTVGTEGFNSLQPESYIGQIVSLPTPFFIAMNPALATGFTMIRRTVLVSPIPLPDPQAQKDYSTGTIWTEALVPRNGGHIVFKPRATGGAGSIYPINHRYGLASTYKTYTMIGAYTDPATANHPIAHLMVTNRVDPGGSGNTEFRVQLQDGGLFVANYLDVGIPVVVDAVANPNFNIAMEWVSPYSMVVKYSYNYDPAVPANDYGNAVWVELYNMSTDGGGVQQFPTTMDNFSPVVQIEGIGESVQIRGTFTNNFPIVAGDLAEVGRWDFNDPEVNWDGNLIVPLLGVAEGTDVITPNAGDPYLTKEISFLADTFSNKLTPAELQIWQNDYRKGAIQQTDWGTPMGFMQPEFTLAPSLTIPGIFFYQAENVPTVSNQIPTCHIQLTGFGIGSRNGVVSNNVKDIAVIPTFVANEDPTNTQLFYSSPYENRININNLEELTVNQIDVLITSDTNQPATFLNEESLIVVKIHDNPA